MTEQSEERWFHSTGHPLLLFSEQWGLVLHPRHVALTVLQGRQISAEHSRSGGRRLTFSRGRLKVTISLILFSTSCSDNPRTAV